MARDYSCRSEDDHYSIYGERECSLLLSLVLKYVHTGGTDRKNYSHESSISH